MTSYQTYEQYWQDISNGLNIHIRKSVPSSVTEYIERCLALYSFTTEDLDLKITANKSVSRALIVPLVETQDLLRGALALYQNLTLAPLALVLRTSFEIYCCLEFIQSRSNPAEYADRFFRFQEIEKMKHANAVSGFEDLIENENEILKKNPEWMDPKTGKLVKKAHWAGEFNTVEKLANACGLIDSYNTVYRTNSKFTHGSPLLKNMYAQTDGLTAIPKVSIASQMAIQATYYCMLSMKAFCQIYGIELPSEEEEEKLNLLLKKCVNDIDQISKKEIQESFIRLRAKQKKNEYK